MTEEARPAAEARQRNSALPFIIAGVVLVALGIVIAVWRESRDDGPDYAADCRLAEEKAPDLGPAQSALISSLQAGPGADQHQAAAGIDGASDVFREIADGLTDRQFAAELIEVADAMDRVNEARQERDLSAMIDQVQPLIDFVPAAVSWLDEHCPRWLGPGQWGEPGSDPTLSTELPSLPTEFPTGVPSELPTLPSDFTSLPGMPTSPSGNAADRSRDNRTPHQARELARHRSRR